MGDVSVELRCPGGKLLAKSLLTGDYRLEGQLIEVACRHCRAAKLAAGEVCVQALHRFDVEGQMVETVYKP